MMEKKTKNQTNLSKENNRKLNIINGVIEEFVQQGFKLNRRQLFYELVKREIISNEEEKYYKLRQLLSTGIASGFLKKDSIEGRIGVNFLHYYDIIEVNKVEGNISNRQESQGKTLELWLQRDTLSSVMRHIASYYHINSVINNKFLSVNDSEEVYSRMGGDGVILYVGDFDPYGLNMIEDISEAFLGYWDFPDIIHVAITKEQIEKYNLPPSPRKIIDPRTKSYIQKYGEKSWEIESMNPIDLHQIIKEQIEGIIDMEIFLDRVESEELSKKEPIPTKHPNSKKPGGYSKKRRKKNAG